MPTEDYVRRKFYDGMACERWLEGQLRTIAPVVKLRDVSSEPHRHEDIRDVPASPDITVSTKKGEFHVWVTHKRMKRSLWLSRREEFIRSMYWRLKTARSMKDDHYLAYVVYDKNANIVGGQPPYEVLWCRVSETTQGKLWGRPASQNQDDWRMEVNMSGSKVIYTEETGLIPEDIAGIL